MILPKINQIQYRRITKEDIETVMDFLSSAYATNPYSQIGNTPDFYLPLFKTEIVELCQIGQGHVGIDGQTKKIVGISLLSLHYWTRTQKVNQYQNPILYDLYVQSQKIISQNGLSRQTLDLSILATDPHYRLNGIASKLVELSQKYVIQKGFSYMISAVINCFTGLIYNKREWKKILQIDVIQNLQSKGISFANFNKIHQYSSLWMKKFK